MKKQFNRYYITFFCLYSNFVLFAQPGSGNDTNDLENADPSAPINDYLLVLALVGLIFVFIKMNYNLKKRTNSIQLLSYFESSKIS